MTDLFKTEFIADSSELFFTQKPYQVLTSKVEISVWPEYIDSRKTPVGEIFIWAYQVRIENRNKFPIQLISRYWRIIDQEGEVQEVKGEGVVGEQPIINSSNSFQYSSGVHLRCPSGIMTGFYKMRNLENSKEFEVKIPTFSLDAPETKTIVN